MDNRRKGKREAALGRFGGTRRTERAVADGLAWLAVHQRPDGVWDRLHFDRLCPENDRCSQTAITHVSRNADVGVSALAARAFLGAGHTHERGPYADNLSRVFSYILAQQDTTGSFSASGGFQTYNDAIATLAIAEAFILTHDPVFENPLERAVGHLARSQQLGGGWDYSDDATTNRNDTSITSWVLMALKSAQAAGITIPRKTRFRLVKHFDRATDRAGRVWYADRREGDSTRRVQGPYRRRFGPAMIATALFARSAFGFRLDDAGARRQVELLLGDLPSLRKLRGRDRTGLHSEYYWYYGTLALFNVGGKPWEVWNQALRETVMEYQERPVSRKGKRGHAYGSWPAFGRGWGKWGRTGGRVYSTAINTLTLEVYYRYIPAYLSPRGLIGPKAMRRRITEMGPGTHGNLLELALRFHPDTAEPILLDLLESPDAKVALRAAIALAKLGSPEARPVLESRRARAKPRTRRRIGAALRRIVEPIGGSAYGAITEIDSQAEMFLFETGGRRIYYRQRVDIVRGGRVIGAARVNRRFTPQQMAAARIMNRTTPIKKGDTIQSRGTPS
ncbi:MAG: HEAT repeat domain-containing protein [Phycisphaerae bacterium]